MTHGALEPEAVAFAQGVALELVEPDFERAGHHVNELFTLMRIRSIASGARLDPKDMAFQLAGSDRQELETDA